MRRTVFFGVPYTSMAKPGGIADAIGVLRELGLAERLGAHGVGDRGDLELPAPDGVRGPSGLVNESALAALVETVAEAVRGADGEGVMPLLVGGDCPVILGALAGLGPDTGLVMVDGHEDAWPPALSPTGEASDSEVALALGRAGGPLPPPLDELVPLINADAIAMLGPRDAAEIADGGGASLAGEIGYFLDDRRLSALGDQGLATAIEAIGADRFWLHVDLDVLSTEEFAAVDYPQPGGIDLATLSAIVSRALADTHCAGASFVIYNPDLDPERIWGDRLVDFLAVSIGREDARLDR